MRPIGAVLARTLHGSSCTALVWCQPAFMIRARVLHFRGMSSSFESAGLICWRTRLLPCHPPWAFASGVHHVCVTVCRPEDSRHFKAEDSSTFVAQTGQTFDLNYADGSHLRGFSGVDQVYMGDYKATSPFGHCPSCIIHLWCRPCVCACLVVGESARLCVSVRVCRCAPRRICIYTPAHPQLPAHT